MNDKNETSVGASPDQQAQQGALGVASGSAPTYAEILKALDELHIVCECATLPQVEEWYRGDDFAKQARANAIAVLCRAQNPRNLYPTEREEIVKARVIFARNGNVRFWEILPNHRISHGTK